MTNSELDPYRVDPDGIDDDLKNGPWMLWKIEENRGKAPRRPDDPLRYASSNEVSTMDRFEKCYEVADGADYGIGKSFALPMPFVAIDIDIPEGDTDEWLPDLGRLGGATAEYSPSGNYRVYLRDVDVPEWWKNQAPDGADTREVKLFEDKGYVTVTGDLLDGETATVGETEQEEFVDWLKDAYFAFHPEADADDEDAETPLWERTRDDDGNTSGGTSGPTTEVGVGIYDVVSNTVPEGERTSHPIHGSSTGSNFMIDEGAESWRCWNHEVTGHAGHLLGQDVGVLDCEDAGETLTSDTWREIYDEARKQGYDIETKDRAKADAAAADVPSPDDLDFDPDEDIAGPTGIEPARLLDAKDVNSWSPREVSGTSVVVRGQVAKRAEQQVRYESIGYECMDCHGIEMVSQPSQGKKRTPDTCSGCEGEYFYEREDESILADYQTIRLQELPERTGQTTGDTIDVDLLNELVDMVTPGDRVLVETLLEPEDGDKVIQSLTGTASGIHPLEPDIEDIDVEPHDETIDAIAAGDHDSEHHPTGDPDDDPFELLRRSIAPKHEGDDMVKMALVYQLFLGGTNDGELAATGGGRDGTNTLHICLIGDPSTNKSGLLLRVRELMPRGIYTSGKGSSAAGLTATAQQDQFGDGGWTLEAGALVRANGGIACIDELDKMQKTDRQGMLECMSEQQVSVAKAGMESTFPASTTILSAANPESGHFTDYESIGEEVGISSPVLSRFDMTFVMRDEQDADRDERIAERMNAAEMDRTGGDSPEGVIDPPLDVELIRAYVQRAHRLTPTLTADAAELVKEDYVDIRSDDRFADMLGEVSSRSVGTIHALAEASARIRLSETTEPEDVERATEIHRAMKSNLSDTDLSGVPEGVGPDTFEAGTDGSLSKTGASRSDVDIDSLDQKARLDHVFQTMGELANEAESNDDPNHVAAYEADIRDELLDHGFSGSQIDHDIDKLAKQDRVYQPKIGQYDTL